jgi:hypothetical protein
LENVFQEELKGLFISRVINVAIVDKTQTYSTCTHFQNGLAFTYMVFHLCKEVYENNGFSARENKYILNFIGSDKSCYMSQIIERCIYFILIFLSQLFSEYPFFVVVIVSGGVLTI